MDNVYGWTSLRETVSSVTHFHYALEAILIATMITFFLMRRQRQIGKRKHKVPELTDQEKDDIIAAWVPEPLVPETAQEEAQNNFKQRFVEGKMGKTVSIDGKEYLNLATYNFLGFVGDKRIEEVAKQTIFKYGVGSCGPRGFYGTVDVHLDLEKELAQYMGCEEAVLYSYGFATIASAIPAYAKRGDIIYADKGVNFAVQKGLQASRSRIEWFEHNDMDDLERLLKVQAEEDKKNPKKANLIRRFIVVEGLYAKTADLCPLPKIMELKWKYKVRVFMDESLSFGVIGKMGKGVTEHFGVPVVDVDMIMVSLENAIASTGGFCCGRSYVVGHQRLSGLGYCFSASLPPLLATAANEALRIMSAEPNRFQRLQQNALDMHRELVEACRGTNFQVSGIELSPIQHIIYRNPNLEDESESTRHDALRESKLDALVEELFNVHSIIVTRARYLTHEEVFRPEPSVKIMCNSEMVSDEIRSAMKAVKEVIQKIT